MLSNLVARQSMFEVKPSLTNELTNDQSTIEAQMATCIQSFFKHHASKRSRKKCEQDALVAVLVACSFGDVPAAYVAGRLGVSRQKVQECKVWGQGLRDDGRRFEPAERQKSSECYRGATT
jgi:hypothetical protein